ncbi:MAG TPA: arginine--tRNA ligase [Terriglobia bacterium]|nr:arginine--tRNA ligase [Terriglobia bacterium]
MYLETQQRVREKFVQAVEQVFGVKISEPALGFPPSVEWGEISIAACFELAKQLRQAPRKIAEQLIPHLMPLEGVERVSPAGAGYLNFHLDRARMATALFKLRTSPPLPRGDSKTKILVEHTSINPNKAAHIGHLRNAVLGDAFVRLLKFRGNNVEVQNYIDNTGVQVADVVEGFVHLEKKSLDEVRKLTEAGGTGSGRERFDYVCWDLYARVFQLYEENKESLAWRSEALKAIEEGHGDLALMAEAISTAIVRLHLGTMLRINVRYDLLVQESEILKLDFWRSAFELMKQKGAVRYEEAGKNRGCWVMSINESGSERDGDETADEGVKIIVRSNGTVTYVGKDIAYHLWKFGLLGKDFGYQKFENYPDGQLVWRTAIEGGTGAPPFGHAARAFAVIDTRQSYVQNVVHAAFLALGYHEQAQNLHHFAYEVVNLSLKAAEEMKIEISDEDRQRNYLEVSGRKGLGVKADHLIDLLIEKATQEVQSREITRDAAEQNTYAGMIAVGALRYFLLKFSRRNIIAFDFKEALAFEGETGPYLQYSVVRARNIFRKYEESHPDFTAARWGESNFPAMLQKYLAEPGGRNFWELLLTAAQLEMVVDQAIAAEEPAVLAKYAFRMAQAFNNFYHRHHILNEPDTSRQYFLLYLVQLFETTLRQTLDLLGIEVPERM